MEVEHIRILYCRSDTPNERNASEFRHVISDDEMEEETYVHQDKPSHKFECPTNDIFSYLYIPIQNKVCAETVSDSGSCRSPTVLKKSARNIAYAEMQYMF